MRKTAKRLAPPPAIRAEARALAGNQASNTKRQLRPPPAPRARVAATGQAPAPAGVIEGRVVGVGATGLARGVLAGGASVEALCPAHIDSAWLAEACARAPIAAVFVLARPSGRHVLWGVFPDAAHAEVRADLVIRGRQVRIDAESLRLSSREARLDLEADGNVALKGRDVTSHARRVNRIKGGSIRLN
jgi:hypothetical protein